jgi:mitochondrial fission protein ELM1
MGSAALLQRLLVALLALHASAATEASTADVVSEALRLHAQSTVLPTHLLEDPELFITSGRRLMADARKLQAVGQEGRYVLIKNPTMPGALTRAFEVMHGRMLVCSGVFHVCGVAQ